ncbi:MFS transporter [Parasphaerochaeta coccoides]|uniref:Major facilitator superfamily MFS_1 n=1 Tax=Parasphaerochaeta coccoides (strain ATCC BAA-1237 / DSM 17374 / SPN1) TaxID=760011 RepID=F4GHR0_PARC1|nr:MFS transporter [Parasphaerochaeta coccoides]AEC01598.1 major facilitator superfamily MFS_1 [Parasphaerochaeta coccoides DSM 17374]
MQHSWQKTFITIYTGQAISIITSSVLGYAIIWYVTKETQSAAMLSLTTFMSFLPRILFGPLAGSVIDRTERKLIMICADVFVALTSLSLVFVVGRIGSIPIPLILIAAFFRSLGTAFHEPTLQVIVAEVVPPHMLTKSAGYAQAVLSVSLIAGPALAAALFSVWPLEWIILLDVAGAVCGTLTVIIARIPKRKKIENETPLNASPAQLFREMIDGIALVHRFKGLGLIFLGSFLFGVVFLPVAAIFPLMTMSYLGKTTIEAGIVEIAFSVGMLLGGLVLGIWGGTKNRIVSMGAANLLSGAFLLSCGLLSPAGFVAFAILTGLLGFMTPFYNGPFTALLQERIPSQYLGRIMSLSTTTFSLSAPFGLILSGLFAEILGVNVFFLLSGISVTLITLLFVIPPSVRNLDKDSTWEAFLRAEQESPSDTGTKPQEESAGEVGAPPSITSN